MMLSRALLPALALSMMTAVAFAADSQAQPASCGVMGWLTPEERLVLMAEMRRQTANMTDDQKHAFRQSRRAKFQSMSDADKANLAGDLKAKWDALAPARQSQMRQDAEKTRAEHPMMARLMDRRGC